MKNNSLIVDNAKVMVKGQITLPKDIREALGVDTGDRVMFIRQKDKVIMMNSAVYALKVLQHSMKGESEEAALYSDEDVVNLISTIRSETK